MLDAYLDTLLASLGFDPALRTSAGVTVAGRESRRGTSAAVGYRIGRHLVVSCDPALESQMEAGIPDLAPTLDAWARVADDLGGDLIAYGRQQLIAAPLPAAVAVPDGFIRRSLRAESAADFALIERLIAVSDPDDLDEAEVAIDDLDPIIEVLLDGDGQIACYGAARPFDLAAPYGDIGILTRADCRGRGLGLALVADLCHAIRNARLEPLYRCDEANVASVRLSAGLGFEVATRLAAFRFPTPSAL